MIRWKSADHNDLTTGPLWLPWQSGPHSREQAVTDGDDREVLAPWEGIRYRASGDFYQLCLGLKCAAQVAGSFENRSGKKNILQPEFVAARVVS